MSDSKPVALALWVTFSFAMVVAMAAPLYFLRHIVFARADYIVLISGLFFYATWTWLRLAYVVGKRINNPPDRQQSVRE